MCSSVSGFPPGAGSGWYGPPLRETTLYYMQASFRNSGSGVQPQVNATTTKKILLASAIYLAATELSK